MFKKIHKFAFFFSHYSFPHFRLSFWDHFPSSCNMSFKISFSECLLLVKSIFDSLKNVYFFIWKDVFTGSTCLGDSYFLLAHWGSDSTLLRPALFLLISQLSVTSHFYILFLGFFSNILGHFWRFSCSFVILFIVCIVIYWCITNYNKI